MKRLGLVFVLVSFVLPGLAVAQTAFWLRNTDPDALFVYWTIDGAVTAPPQQILASLPLAPGGHHGVAPGERVRVILGPDRILVGAFVPWGENLSFQTVVSGGFLQASEVPSKGTLLVDRPSFALANQHRHLEAPLQQWNLSVPQFVLDGKFTDWAKIRPAMSWGPGFLPGGQPWPTTWPKPQSIQAVSRDEALWIHFSCDRSWSSIPVGVSVSLALRRAGTFLEWPLTGKDGTVWSWAEGTSPVAVGWRILQGGELEAWVVWDRVTAAQASGWISADASWSLLVTQNEVTKILDLGPTSPGEWP